MAPVPFPSESRAQFYSLRHPFTRLISSNSQFDLIKLQWQNPQDILSILTIIGADIVQRAVAQLAGHPYYFTPVAFSFGWVGYALNALLAIMGEGKLMPPADCDCILVNATTQYSKQNKSWVLGRLVRDLEKNATKPGLTVTFYKTSSGNQGIPSMDWVYYSGVIVIVAQLGISVIPGVLYEDWTILMVTAIGTLLSILGGALPKWKKEKWSCRKMKKNDKAVICLTRGNGYNDVFVIISEGEGHLRLEDLANARDVPVSGTFALALVLCICQALLLLTVAGLKNNAWFLLLIGSLGIVQNGVAAGVRRAPGTTGIHLEKQGESIRRDKVFPALQDAEERERYVGISLLAIFFNSKLRPHEEQWREEKLASHAKAEHTSRPTSNLATQVPQNGEEDEKQDYAQQANSGVYNSNDIQETSRIPPSSTTTLVGK
ncbi:unnamed protein product [Somion occarium]|uniref:Uncharacterized protein n=1 Tax=Somion occarium TaxID=3059160 RepID=A0ABP1CR03_9APHY